MLRKAFSALALCTLLAASASAQAPARMPMQGVLHNLEGEPVTGAVTIQFALYTDEFDGEALWRESQRVVVESGLFTAFLGDEVALDLGIFALQPQVWVGVTVDDDSEMPRVPLATVPWAAWANAAGDAATLNGFDATTLLSSAQSAAADDAAARYAPLGHLQPWSTITDVPSEIADGDADLLAGISCSIGEILRHGPLGWACDAESPDGLEAVACVDGGILRFGPAGWFCGIDVDTDTLADIACAEGQIVRAGVDGWYCSADANSGGDITAVTAGTGLSGGGTVGDVSVAVDFGVTQRRVNGSCAAHQVITTINADGTVNCGDRFVTRYQRDGAAETRSTYNPVRYHLSATATNAGGDTTPIPQDVIEDLCADFDGCQIRLGMTRWSNNNQRAAASRDFIFYYDVATRSHRASDSDGEGIDGNGATNHSYVIWDTCFFTDGEYTDYSNRGDPNVGMSLLVWNDYNFAGRTCEITILD